MSISLSEQFKQSHPGSLNYTQWIFFSLKRWMGWRNKKTLARRKCKEELVQPWVSGMTVFIQQMFMVCPFVPGNTVLTSLPIFKLQIPLNAIKIKVTGVPEGFLILAQVTISGSRDQALLRALSWAWSLCKILSLSLLPLMRVCSHYKKINKIIVIFPIVKGTTFSLFPWSFESLK